MEIEKKKKMVYLKSLLHYNAKAVQTINLFQISQTILIFILTVNILISNL